MNVKENVVFDLTTQKNVDQWLEGQYDEETKATIRRLLTEDPQQIVDAFFTHLTFGTAGLRGLMGVGTNRMNIYTVRATTQGLANYVLKQPKQENKNHAVLIGYDSRHYSREFAEETARVLAGNGIEVYLFKNIRPTPLVSFGCRYKKCMAAVMITASHNPAVYNGYKVYWSDGGQVVQPHDIGIIAEVEKITDPTEVRLATNLSDPLIHEIEAEIDEAYIKAITPLQNYPEINQQKGDQLKVVYTSLHGTGITLAPRALTAWGFKNPTLVGDQVIPNGDFPTVKSPNPEEKAALQMGIDLMLKTQSDLLIANDPDADRVGVAVLHKNDAYILNGNQIAAICLAHICEALSKQNRLPSRAAFIKTIGTTELFRVICQDYQRKCFNVLTGFKYIAEKIREWELLPDGYQYIFGGEESYGYLLGTHARDKDAIVCSALLCEVALHAKLEGKTLVDRLYDLYQRYGVYQEKLLSINFGETKEGKEQMAHGMQRLRQSHLHEINGIPVVSVEDYLVSTRYFLETGKTEPIPLIKSDVLLYWLADESKVMVRPSGTEPKVKLYCGVVEKTFPSIEEGIQNSLKRCDDILVFMRNHLMEVKS